MATVVPFAYCYGNSTLHQPLQLFGKSRKCGYMSLIAYRSPCNVPRPRLACNAPKLTLRQICRMLRVMRYEAAAAANNRKQASSPPPPGSPAKSDRRCLPSCFRRRRNTKSPPPNLPTTVSTQTSTENPETQKTCIFPIWRGQKWTSD